MERKSGWNWWAFFFAPAYYAGYGDLTKGIIFAIVNLLIPIVGLFIAIYAGLKANQELPVGEVEFNWKNVGIVIAVLFITLVSLQFMLAVAERYNY